MSEAEKKKRLSYKERRKKLIYAQIAIMIVIAIFDASIEDGLHSLMR